MMVLQSSQVQEFTLLNKITLLTSNTCGAGSPVGTRGLSHKCVLRIPMRVVKWGAVI